MVERPNEAGTELAYLSLGWLLGAGLLFGSERLRRDLPLCPSDGPASRRPTWGVASSRPIGRGRPPSSASRRCGWPTPPPRLRSDSRGGLAEARWGGIVLLSAAIAKVYLLDLGSLALGYRVLSLLVLAAALLAVSYAYQRRMRTFAA